MLSETKTTPSHEDKMRAARLAAMRLITNHEQADNFRNPEKLKKRQEAGTPTSFVTLDASMPRDEALQALDAVTNGSQELFRQAVQQLVLAEVALRMGLDVSSPGRAYS